MRRIIAACIITGICSCTFSRKEKQTVIPAPDSVARDSTTFFVDTTNPLYMQTGNTQPETVVNFAQTLIGVPYKYASINPAVGFDCSGL